MQYVVQVTRRLGLVRQSCYHLTPVSQDIGDCVFQVLVCLDHPELISGALDLSDKTGPEALVAGGFDGSISLAIPEILKRLEGVRGERCLSTLYERNQRSFGCLLGIELHSPSLPMQK